MASPEIGIPPADALPVQRQATIGFRIARLLIGPLLHLCFRLPVSGRAHIPADGPYVVIANHLNWLDPFLLLLTFPPEPRLHFLANPENLVKHRIHWWIIRKVGGYIPVDMSRRAEEGLFTHVHRCFQRGGVVAIFPEAAYGPGEGELQPFKKGFAHFAVDASVPVIPVALSGTKDLWLGKTVRVMIGQAIPSGGHDADSLAAVARARLDSLLPVYEEPRGPKLLRRWLTRLLY